jgi:hypothetical protein
MNFLFSVIWWLILSTLLSATQKSPDNPDSPDNYRGGEKRSPRTEEVKSDARLH